MAPSLMAAIPALKETFMQLKTRMDKAVEDFRNSLAATRTGRASVHMLDGVKIEVYGSEMPLTPLAQVLAEAQLIAVKAYHTSTLPAIEKALRHSDLACNAQL